MPYIIIYIYKHQLEKPRCNNKQIQHIGYLTLPTNTMAHNDDNITISCLYTIIQYESLTKTVPSNYIKMITFIKCTLRVNQFNNPNFFYP